MSGMGAHVQFDKSLTEALQKGVKHKTTVKVSFIHVTAESELTSRAT